MRTSTMSSLQNHQVSPLSPATSTTGYQGRTLHPNLMACCPFFQSESLTRPHGGASLVPTQAMSSTALCFQHATLL